MVDLWRLTGAAIVLFWLLGMPAWQAVNHGMTVAATGGFTINGGGMEAYGPRIRYAATVFMFLGAVSFAAYYAALRQRRPLKFLRQPATLVLAAGIAGVTAIMVVFGLRAPAQAVGFGDALFQVVSALATAGFSTADLSGWHAILLALLVACMVIGGASGSTAGGLKLDRVMLILRGVWWRIERPFRAKPEGAYRTVAGETLAQQRARNRVETAATLAAIWLTTLLAGAVLLAPAIGPEASFIDMVFETASALGSVGLSSGVTAPDLPGSAKWVLITLMWLGRLEIFAAVSLLYLGGRWLRGGA